MSKRMRHKNEERGPPRASGTSADAAIRRGLAQHSGGQPGTIREPLAQYEPPALLAVGPPGWDARLQRPAHSGRLGTDHQRGERGGGRSGGTPKYLLSGMVFWGSCHAELYPRKISGKRRLLPAGAPHRAGHLQGRRRRCVQIERPMEDTRDWISRKRGEAGRLPGGSPGEDCR